MTVIVEPVRDTSSEGLFVVAFQDIRTGNRNAMKQGLHRRGDRAEKRECASRARGPFHRLLTYHAAPLFDQLEKGLASKKDKVFGLMDANRANPFPAAWPAPLWRRRSKPQRWSTLRANLR